HFTEGNIPAGMINAPEGWAPPQVAEFQEWWDSKLSANVGEQTKLIWGPAGSTFQPFTESPYADTFDQWLARIVCYAFSLPPTAFTPQVNRATAETAQDTALEEGLAPLMAWAKRWMDALLERRGQLDLEFVWAETDAIDPVDQSVILDRYTKDGIYTINEARDKLGLDPVEGGDQPMLYLPAGPVLLKDIEAMSEQMANPPPPPAPIINPIASDQTGDDAGNGGAPGKAPQPP